eukprot:g35656.t1
MWRNERIQKNGWIIFLLTMAAVFWVYRLVKVICNLLSYWEIRTFYIKALKIPTAPEHEATLPPRASLHPGLAPPVLIPIHCRTLPVLAPLLHGSQPVLALLLDSTLQ